MADDSQGELLGGDILSRLLADGSPEAFGEFVGSTGPALLRYFYRRTREAESAADLAAETYAAALQSRPSFDPAKGTATQWLYGIARNQLKTLFKNYRVSGQGLERLALERPIMDDITVAMLEELEPVVWLRPDLGFAVASLSEKQRQAVELRVVAGLGYSEVAARLGINEDAARARVARGLHTLYERLER